MKALVVYDTVYGNTEKIAQAINDGLSTRGESSLVRAATADAAALKGIDLLVVGAPTQGGRPTLPVQDFMKMIPANGLKNVKIAAFDTRITRGGVGTFARLFGYAAGRIESELKKRGGTSVGAQGFSVTGREGPLQEGEIERAKKWGADLGSK